MPTVNGIFGHGYHSPLSPVQALMGYFQKRNVHCSTTIEGWHRFFSEMVRWGALEDVGRIQRQLVMVGLSVYKKNTVVKTMINHPIVDGLYHPFIVICGLFIIVLTTLV